MIFSVLAWSVSVSFCWADALAAIPTSGDQCCQGGRQKPTSIHALDPWLERWHRRSSPIPRSLTIGIGRPFTGMSAGGGSTPRRKRARCRCPGHAARRAILREGRAWRGRPAPWPAGRHACCCRWRLPRHRRATPSPLVRPCRRRCRADATPSCSSVRCGTTFSSSEIAFLTSGGSAIAICAIANSRRIIGRIREGARRRLIVGQCRLRLVGALQEDFGLVLLEVGIVGKLRDQAVGERDRLLEIGLAGLRVGNGARVARLEAVVGLGIAFQHLRHRLGIAAQLGLYALEPHDKLRSVRHVAIGRMRDMLGHGIDATLRQGVRAQVGILLAREQRFLLAEDPEELEHAAGRLMGVVEKLHAGLVGGGLLRARKGQQRRLTDLLIPADRRRPRRPGRCRPPPRRRECRRRSPRSWRRAERRSGAPDGRRECGRSRAR